MTCQEDIEREFERVDKPTLVIGGGGSPCQGLSKLSSERKHFQDERSELFYALADRLDWIREICAEKRVKFLGLVENVQMDEKDRGDVTMRLGWAPNLCESGDISWVRRPRFYWISEDLPECPWMRIQHQPLGNKIKLIGDLELENLWLPEGLKWEAQSNSSRFPTFTRPIPRRRPPPKPAGLEQTSREGQARWAADSFRYPPYVYMKKNSL